MKSTAVLALLLSSASALQFTKTSASVGHPFLRYDAFLFDGLGTLHDNVRARPWAAAAIEALQLAGKLVIVGSNSPKDNDDEREFLTRLGVTNGLATSLEYATLKDDVPMVSVFTSGHVAREALRKPGPSGFAARCGDRPLVLGVSPEELARLHPAGDVVAPAASLEDATCLLAYASAPTAEDYAIAERAGELGLPLLALAGDDVWAPAGVRRLCGVDGLVAAYKNAGGPRASVFGKPHGGFFRKARAIAARHGAADSLCVIGDSLSQDVVGAHDAGLDVAWLFDDVHTDDGRDRVARLLGGDPRRRPEYVIGSLKPPDQLMAQEYDIRVE